MVQVLSCARISARTAGAFGSLQMQVLCHNDGGHSYDRPSSPLCWQEPRGGGQDALKKTMADYYGAIQSGSGGIFFAVCRGKVGGHLICGRA